MSQIAALSFGCRTGVEGVTINHSPSYPTPSKFAPLRGASMALLIVDDSALTRSQLKNLLQKAGFSEVWEADSAKQAFQMLSKVAVEEVELVLMDLVLPEMDGIEACRKLKQLYEIPIIMVTGRQAGSDLQAAFEAGALDYITKPVNEVEMLARVRSVLRLKEEMDRRKEREQQLLEMTQRLEENISFLKRISVLDGLTEVYNRRHFDETLDKEWRRATREASPLSVIMADIDFFKSYNDSYGHLRGDECLKKVAATLKTCVKRPGDLVARYGGEEFILVLPNTHSEGAYLLAQSLRKNLENLAIPHSQSAAASHVTISLGTATLVPARGHCPEELVACADRALYQAKTRGRNQVVRWDASMEASQLPASEKAS